MAKHHKLATNPSCHLLQQILYRFLRQDESWTFTWTSGYPGLCRDIGTPMHFLLLHTFFSSPKALHPTVVDQCSVLSLIFFPSLSTLNQHLHGCILNCTLRQLIIQVQRMGWIRQPVNFRSNKKSPGVPGRARSAFCDGPELRHGRMDVVNL
jgi:hypothetical protein